MLYKKAPASAGACLIPFCMTMRFMVGSGAAGVSERCRADAGLAAKIMQYLLAYQYGTELVIKLTAAMK